MLASKVSLLFCDWLLKTIHCKKRKEKGEKKKEKKLNFGGQPPSIERRMKTLQQNEGVASSNFHPPSSSFPFSSSRDFHTHLVGNSHKFHAKSLEVCPLSLSFFIPWLIWREVFKVSMEKRFPRGPIWIHVCFFQGFGRERGSQGCCGERFFQEPMSKHREMCVCVCVWEYMCIYVHLLASKHNPP